MEYRKWIPEETKFLQENYRKLKRGELSAALDRSPSSISAKLGAMSLLQRKWSEADDEYLSEHWGHTSIPGLCVHLQRSEAAIMVRVQRLGLPPFLESGDYITLNQLLFAVKGTNAGGNYTLTSWVENRGLPIHRKRVREKRVRVVYLEEFWEWAEKNRSFIDFSKMEPLALGKEPAWVAEQRKKDFVAFANQRKDPWTDTEDERLIRLLKQHKYGYADLSDMLRRSSGAIQRRCNDLGIKERPVKADNRNEWTDEHFRLLADGIRAGDSYTDIGRAVGRSEKAVRGKVYCVYLTENADKIRAMMGDGEWGDGAPVPTVKQAVSLSRCRTSTLNDLSKLAGLLAYQRNELGYEPYWQRHMCMKWHNIKGCTAGCADCDSCSEFERIRPQYCVRCGATFLEREENRICPHCRVTRKKQHQRKWQRLHRNSPVYKDEKIPV